MSGYQVNPQMVDWESSDSCLFFNQRQRDRDLFEAYVPRLPYLKGHVWLSTSGRQRQKWVALSKQAILHSALAVNQHLQISAKDRWGICLKLFHIGGLAITARAHLSKSPCFFYNQKWAVKGFLDFLKAHKITLCSLVPTQVYDLVSHKCPAPPDLRAVVVGGDYLSKVLFQSAKMLGWPLLPSYGLTESSSQVATAKVIFHKKNLSKNPAGTGPIEKTHPVIAQKLGTKDLTYKLYPLSHVQIKIVKGDIAIRSKSLLTGFVPLLSSLKATFQDPKQEGWYWTGDKGEWEADNCLKITHAKNIKILGEKVSILRLREIFMDLLLKHSLTGLNVLMPAPHDRKGSQIILVTDTLDNKITKFVEEFNHQVSPFERITSIYGLPSLPKTDIGKIHEQAILKQLGFPSPGFNPVSS